jgi:hypothetical protein
MLLFVKTKKAQFLCRYDKLSLLKLLRYLVCSKFKNSSKHLGRHQTLITY